MNQPINDIELFNRPKKFPSFETIMFIILGILALFFLYKWIDADTQLKWILDYKDLWCLNI